jgi:CRISPR-associated Csx14 family protein
MDSTSYPPSAVLIATLGTEPQVVTATLDLLLRKGEKVREVAVLHSVAPGTAIALAVDSLSEAFDQAPQYSSISLHLCPLLDSQGYPLPDVETPQAAAAAFRSLYSFVRDAKMDGSRVHLSIAGGRKTLAVYGMLVAQLLFDEQDNLWHLYSTGDFLASKRLHPQAGDEVHLIPIPTILWSQVSPAWMHLIGVDDPFEAVERVRRLQLNEKVEQARSFILGSLTPAERRAVELLVREGLGDNEIAGRLALSPRTVEQQLRSAYHKAAAHWELPDVNRASMVALLSLYYSVVG